MMIETIKPKLSVLFIGLKYDYGDPARGYSYEYLNFFDTMMKMKNVSVTLFPFDEVMRNIGRSKMNHSLLEMVEKINPDICFFFLFTDEIKKDTIRAITEKKKTITLNWFADDHWRFEIFSKFWAKLFHYVVTTDKQSIENYMREGCHNVILSQWGYNHHLIKPLTSNEKYDVTFVGQAHSNRIRLINNLRKHGINLICWGKGWPNGRLTHEEMIKIILSSKINLNFTESSFGFRLKPLMKIFLRRRADDSIRFNSFKVISSHIPLLFRKNRSQIKGRNFEIPGLGGFLLTESTNDIGDYFIPDREIAIFSTEDELRYKIDYFLTNDDEREMIRKAGQQRVLMEHTYEKRFEHIFKQIFGYK